MWPASPARRISRLLPRAWASPALRATAALGAGGAGFAIGNLLLARALPAATYGRIALAIAFIQIGAQLGPAGINGVINRQHLDTGPAILSRAAVTTALASFALLALGWLLYRVPISLLLLIGASASAGSLGLVASAHYQSRQRFGPSLALSQSPNMALLAVGAFAIVASAMGEMGLLAVLAVGYLVPAAVGWITILRRRRVVAGQGSEAFRWSEALSYLGVQMAGAMLVQAERLALPRVLSFEALALFGVLAATAGAPFRMFQSGVGYTTVPRLSASRSIRERRRILLSEAALICTIAVSLGLILIPLTPPIVRILLAGRYDVSRTLTIAVVLAGLIKVLSSFSVSAAAALTPSRELGVLNWLGWIAFGTALAGGVLGAHWGLIGVIYGVAVGWALRAVVAGYLAARYFGLALPGRPPITELTAPPHL